MALHYSLSVGLFETVQLELFEFMGFKPPAKNNRSNSKPRKKAQKESETENLDLETLPYPVRITRKSHLRGLRFRVSLQGVLEISASKSTKEPDILQLLEPHQNWILSQMSKHEALRSEFPQKKWQSGQVFPLKGENYKLIFSPSLTKKAHIRFMEHSFEYFFPLSWQELPKEVFQEKIHEKFLYFFKIKAAEELNARVNYWAHKMSAFPRSVSFRNQKSRWGSCSSDGKISLNWRLIAFDDSIRDYVIIHELAHLSHQNHSAAFWKLVEDFCPERKKISRQLQKNAFIADCYSKQSELYEHNPILN